MSKFDTEIKKALEKAYKDGLLEGYKKGLKDGEKGFITGNPKIYGKFYDVYKEVFTFAINTNKKSLKKFNPPSKYAEQDVLPRSCLWKVGERALILHRSIFTLCEHGWTSVVPIIMRSLLECALNLGAILTRDSNYMAFRYYSKDFLNDLIDKEQETKVIDCSKKQIEDLLKRVCSKDYNKAKDYVDEFLEKKKNKTYWYRPEYSSASKILSEDLYFVYKSFSDSVHSSLIGMNLFKDESDKVDINARDDTNSIKMALVQTSRLIYEITNMRIDYEGLDMKEESRAILNKIVELKNI